MLFRQRRNSFLPTLTMIGLSIGWLMGGSVLVETIFDSPAGSAYTLLNRR